MRRIVFIFAYLTFIVPCLAGSVSVDIDAMDYSGPNDTQPGWEPWEMPAPWGVLFGPVMKLFPFGPGSVYVEIDGISSTYGISHISGSRRRDVLPEDYLGKVHQDFCYLALYDPNGHYGRDYFKAKFIFIGLPADTTVPIEFTFWTWDQMYGHAGEPPNSKFAAWSQTNPAQWLSDNGYPGGYEPNNIPAGLDALVLGRSLMIRPDVNDAYICSVNFTVDVSTNASGRGETTFYSWNDSITLIGSNHVPLNGFKIVLEYDLVDFAYLADWWLETGCGQCGGADLTADGNVEYDDLEMFCSWFAE